MIIDASIERLLQYAQSHLLLDDLDVVYKRNVLMDLLGLIEYTVYEVEYDAIDEMEVPDEAHCFVRAGKRHYSARTGRIFRQQSNGHSVAAALRHGGYF